MPDVQRSFSDIGVDLAQANLRDTDDASLERSLTSFAALGQPRDPGELETVTGPDGRPRLIPRSQAVGQSPYQEETNDVRTLRALQEDPSLMAAELERRKASAQRVNVNTRQESEEAKTVGKGFGEMYIELQKAGSSADGKIARYERMGSLLDGVRTGKLTPPATQISAIAASLGISIDPKLGTKQAAEALSNEVALQLRNPSGGAGMPGALSDKDREFLVSMTPSLAKTPEGNKLIIETAVKLAKRDKQVAQMSRDYRKKYGQLNEGFYDELARFSASNPLFPSAPSQGGPSRAEIEAEIRRRGLDK